MRPIKNQFSNEKEMREYFKKNCSDYRNENNSLIFTFLLFEKQNARYSEVLNSNNSYQLEELNNTLGEKIDVFYIDYSENEFSQDYIDFIKSILGLKSNVKLPCLVFFQTNYQGNIIRRFPINLNSHSSKAAIPELNELMKKALLKLEGLTCQDADDAKEIFSSIERSINRSQRWKTLKPVKEKFLKEYLPKIGAEVTKELIIQTIFR